MKRGAVGWAGIHKPKSCERRLWVMLTSRGSWRSWPRIALKHPHGAKKSDRQIAEHVGVSHDMVSRYRKQLELTVTELQSPERTGRDGRTINIANIGKKKVVQICTTRIPFRTIVWNGKAKLTTRLASCWEKPSVAATGASRTQST